MVSLIYPLFVFASLSDDEWDKCNSTSTACSSINTLATASCSVTPLKLPSAVPAEVRNIGLDHPGVTEIKLNKNNLSTICPLFKGLALSQLEKIVCGTNCILCEEFPEILPYLQKLEKLTAIDFTDNDINDPELYNIVQYMPEHIKILCLRRNNISTNGLNALAKFIKLEELYLGYNSLKSSSVHILNNLRNLIILDLRNNPITDVGLQNLSPDCLKKLHLLDLSYTRITDQGIRLIAPHFGDSLTDFHINGNAVTDEGLQILVDHLPNRLQGLDIGYNKINNIDILFQKFPKELKILNVCKIPIKHDFFEKLSTKITHLYFTTHGFSADFITFIKDYLDRTTVLKALILTCLEGNKSQDNHLNEIKNMLNKKNIEFHIDFP